MHHLFGGLSVEPLSHYPFQTEAPGLQVFSAAALGWDFPANPKVYFLPCLGGFVGSDILAGVLATKLHERESLAMLVDLGTNGEIILGNRESLLCAATAAGPAFEGARISMGMRAATGAISEVSAAHGRLHCHVLGNTTPRGICGSGLVDAVAMSLDLGWILPNGRLAKGEALELAMPVSPIMSRYASSAFFVGGKPKVTPRPDSQGSDPHVETLKLVDGTGHHRPGGIFGTVDDLDRA
jgi:uncharacterized 2Fe-2S/4Fe-4S cluster protein (DUF4445 family)